MKKQEISFLTVPEVSEKLRVHWQSTLTFIRTGQLKAYKIGKGYKIKESDLENFISKKATNKKGIK